MKKKIAGTIAIFSLLAYAVDYPINLGEAADTVNLKVEGFYLSQSQDCSSLRTVFEKSDAGFTDFTRSLSLGGGDVPDGEYRCAVLKISDQMRTTVNSLASGTACATFGDTDRDIYSENTTTSGFKGDDLDGNPIGAPSSAEQAVYLFFRIGGVRGGEFNHPLNNNGGGELESPIVVNGSTELSFKLISINQQGGVGSLKRLSLYDRDEDGDAECEPTDSEVIFKVLK